MRLLLIVFISIVLTGCAGIKPVNDLAQKVSSYFLGGVDNTEPPKKLTEYEAELEIEVLWKESVGVGADEHSLKLVPAISYGKILAADREGLLQARDINTGELSWEVETQFNFSGGPGLGDNTVILGTSNAEVLAFNLDNGEQLWKATVSSEVLSIPVVAEGIVVIRTIDGRVIALNEENGEALWSYELNVPALSIRGTGSAIIVEDNVISGFANGKMVALRLTDGKHAWESTVTIPTGTSEVERMVDLDVDPVETDGVIYVASYQGGVSAIVEIDGDVIWRNKDISSYSGLSYDWGYLYLSDAESDIWKLDQRNGRSLWKQDELHQRRLNAPLSFGEYVVVGDFEGYLHWLSASDGHLMARERITRSAINAQAIAINDIVYVYAQDGTLAALKAQAK